LTRRYRLRGPLAFDAVFRAGRRLEGRKLQLIAAPAAGDTGRVGYIIGSRQLKRAIDRNRLKRMLREAIRLRRDRLNSFDLVLRLRRSCAPEELSGAAAEAVALLDALPETARATEATEAAEVTERTRSTQSAAATGSAGRAAKHR
jgi:ribonuclease P protein component